MAVFLSTETSLYCIYDRTDWMDLGRPRVPVFLLFALAIVVLPSFVGFRSALTCVFLLQVHVC